MGQKILQFWFDIGLRASSLGHDFWFLFSGFVIFMVFVVLLILTVAYLTFWERKVLGFAHYRWGPNRCGKWGLLQPLCDAVKLLIKEDIVPIKADWVVWVIAPVVAFAPMVASFLAIPMSNAVITLKFAGSEIPKVIQHPMIAADLGIGLLLIISVSSLVVIGIFTAGFGSNNKYSMFGGVRSAGQIISYEVPIILCLLSVVLVSGSMSTVRIVKAQKFLPPSKINQMLDVEYHRRMFPVFGTGELDWAAMSEFRNLSSEERGIGNEERGKNWLEFTTNFAARYDKMAKQEQHALLVAGQKLEIEYSDYDQTTGSPRLPFIIPLLIAFIVYFIAGVAESNRSPFDLPEGESEIVAGFHTEYSGIKFGLFFLGEYGNMILISAIATTCFLGGYLGPAIPGLDRIAHFVGEYFYYFFWFFLKVFVLVTVMIWFRATFPRLRVDQLSDLAWKVLLPVALLNLLFVGYMQFSDWNLTKIAETNWMLWHGNLVRPFRYPAVRMAMLWFNLQILSNILYPYRKAFIVNLKVLGKTLIVSTFIVAEVFFIIGFMGYDIFTLWFGQKIIEVFLQWTCYMLAAVFVGWMIIGYINAKRAGMKFIPANLEDDEIGITKRKGLIGHQEFSD